MIYPERFKARMIQRMSGPIRETARALAKETGVDQTTLSRWLRDEGVGTIPDTRKNKKLRRKDKALAETAALLVLKKKVQEIWGDGDDDT